MTTYVLAGGCFWCLDAVFRRLKGVESSVCGYAGGTAEEADYYAVATGKTGHAEAVMVTFDEAIIPDNVLLDVYFLIHDPTTKDRQGNDVGPQYRSAMFFADEPQKRAFEAAMLRAERNWKLPLTTELVPLTIFYEAEPEHQDYFNQNPTNGYCNIIIAPKITKVRQAYTPWFKAEYNKPTIT